MLVPVEYLFPVRRQTGRKLVCLSAEEGHVISIKNVSGQAVFRTAAEYVVFDEVDLQRFQDYQVVGDVLYDPVRRENLVLTRDGLHPLQSWPSPGRKKEK